MRQRLLGMAADQRKALLGALRGALASRPEILFAFVHGSFLWAERFRDLDLAIYLRDCSLYPLEMEVKLETELEEKTRPVPLDLRILNFAPPSFRYWVIKEGEALWVSDERAKCDFVERTLKEYLEFAFFRKGYLREALGIGSQPR